MYGDSKTKEDESREKRQRRDGEPLKYPMYPLPVKKVDIAGAGFLNFRLIPTQSPTLSPPRPVVQSLFASSRDYSNIVIEYSSRNVAKPCTWATFARLASVMPQPQQRLIGHRVITDNHMAMGHAVRHVALRLEAGF